MVLVHLFFVQKRTTFLFVSYSGCFWFMFFLLFSFPLFLLPHVCVFSIYFHLFSSFLSSYVCFHCSLLFPIIFPFVFALMFNHFSLSTHLFFHFLPFRPPGFPEIAPPDIAASKSDKPHRRKHFEASKNIYIKPRKQ